MRLSDFDYELPPERIAQQPASRRDASRLLVLEGIRSPVRHERFRVFPSLLRADDLLVLNDTRVIPARLRGTKETGGRCEILLDKPMGPAVLENGRVCQRWACLLNASRPLRAGARIRLPGGGEAIRDGQQGHGQPVVSLRLPEQIEAYLERYGEPPLPAYIRRIAGTDPRFEQDRERYQTVYARDPGAVAAPTAGLHFTPQILQSIRDKGVEVVTVTLHVGPGTFLPVRTEDPDRHVMHAERYRIEPAAAETIERARRAGRRIVAVGTTVVRTLESALEGDRVVAGEGETDLFIRPGFSFKVVDALLTNFHLPRSTLLMLVCALAGTRRVLAAYRQAVEAGYRFYSYGDAMFLVRQCSD